jgi:uncharacterized membrane protein
LCFSVEYPESKQEFLVVKKKIFLSALVLSALLVACAGNNTPASSTTPSATPDSGSPTQTEKVSFSVAQKIIQDRCFMCHSTQGGQSPRAGVNFEDKAQIKNLASRIKARAVDSKGMPQGNATNMSDDERKTLGAWINEGAAIE